MSASSQPQSLQSHYGAALAYTQGLLGWIVNEQETFVSLATTAVTQLVGQNGDRLGLIIMNTGNNNILIGITTGISATQGILLNANGGTVSMDARTDFTLPTRAWFAVATLAPENVYVLEIIGIRKLPAGTQ